MIDQYQRWHENARKLKRRGAPEWMVQASHNFARKIRMGERK